MADKKANFFDQFDTPTAPAVDIWAKFRQPPAAPVADEWAEFRKPVAMKKPNFFDQFDAPASPSSATAELSLAQRRALALAAARQRVANAAPSTAISDLAQSASSAMDATAKQAAPNTAVDMAASLPSGIARGLTETIMLPVTAKRQLDKFATPYETKAVNFVRAAFGYDPMEVPTPEQLSDNPIDRTLNSGQDIVRTIMNDNLYAPKTTPCKYAETVGEFVAPGGAGIKSVGSLVRNAVIPGVMSEAAGQATEGTAIEPWARILAGLAGNIGGSIATAANAPESVLRRAAGPADQIDWAKAVGLQQNSTGIKLTGPEAIAQAQGGATALPDVQRVVEGSIDGGQRMSPFFEQRPQQVDAAVNKVLDQIAPQSARPSTLGPLASDAATKAIRGLEEQRTAAVAPTYQAANADIVPVDQMQTIFDDIGKTVAADKTGILSGPLNDLQKRLTATPATETSAAVPITDIGNLDRARKYFRDRMDLPQIGQDAITKEQNGAVTSYFDRLNAAMEANSPAFVAGKEQYGQISRDVVDPIAQGPLGKVAAAKDTKAAGYDLLPLKPLVGSEAEINDAVKRLVMQDAVNTPSLVRQNLADRFNTASTETAGGAKQFAGSLFHKDIVGNAQREKTLYSVLDGLGNAPAAQAMPELMDVLQATGRRKPIGSATEFNHSINSDLSVGSPKARLFDVAKTLGTSLVQNAGDSLKRRMLRKSVGGLAEMFTAPNSVDLIREALERGAKNHIGDALRRTALQSVIQGQGAR